jgi:solute carrier family 34 (sodium-dependent phosphate cotransporter)
MGESFKLFGKEFAERVLATTANPLTGLFIGILATSLVQSSSTSTSVIVGMVAGGAISLEGAIPMIMGANIGTTITAMLVSLGHINRPLEFQRAFGAALLHTTFNLIAVSILFPLEVMTGALSHLSAFLGDAFQSAGGMKLSNPLKAATEPAIRLIALIVFQQPVLMLLATTALTFGMLIAIVKLLRSLVLQKVENFFDQYLFKTWGRAMLFGLILTVSVQTSSIPTALAIPLAGAGILKLIQVYPFNLGSNVGTTITAMLAALATANEAAIIVAFSHLSFNLIGIIVIWGIPFIRPIPLRIAEKIAAVSGTRRIVPIAIITGLYFVFPLIIILLTN